MNTTTVSRWILAAGLTLAPIAIRGQTAPQRTLTTNPSNAVAPKTTPPPAATPPRTPAEAGNAAGALDSLSNSLQDLNAIRDANLTRVQKDGCPPEVSARLADLRSKLRQNEAELSGEAPAKAPLPQKAGADPEAIASGWFKRPQQDRPETVSQAPVSASTRETKMLADVLPDAPAPAAKSKAPARPREDVEDEIAHLKAEITRLSGSCTALKK